MLSKKSPRTNCRIGICNNRIGANGFSNRNCGSAPSLESIFRAGVSKIVFRQHRSIASVEQRRWYVGFTPDSGHGAALPRTVETGQHRPCDERSADKDWNCNNSEHYLTFFQTRVAKPIDPSIGEGPGCVV